MKTLVYSTEEVVREKIKSILGDHYDMVLVDSIEQCKEVIKNTDVSTLIFDIDKQGNPLDDIKAIHSENSDLKIISLGRNEETVKAGSAIYILKPIKSDELLAVCSS